MGVIYDAILGKLRTDEVGTVTGGDVSYDNSTSLLAATTVQGAIDELDGVVDALIGGVSFEGEYDAATNTPDLDVAPAGIMQGFMYKVSVAGNFFATAVYVGDTIIAKINNPTVIGDWVLLQVELATTSAPGIVELATDGESAANVAVQGNDSRMSNARTPTAHAASHVGGSDPIQVATAAQNGLATAAQITKLDGIEALADVTDTANVTAALTAATPPAVTPALDDKALVQDTSSANALSTVTIQQIVDLAHTSATHVVYVGKNGNDANSGLRTNIPKLTIESAITAANSLISGGASAVRIDVLDAGSYTPVGTVAIAANVHLFAPEATVIGVFTIAGGGSMVVNEHYASTTGIMVNHGGGTTLPAVYVARLNDGRGTGGALTTTTNVNCAGANCFMLANVGHVIVAQNGAGLISTATGVGRMTAVVGELQIAGNTGHGIRMSTSGALLTAKINRIAELGSPTSTVGISQSNGTVILMVNEIVVDAPYAFSGGALYLDCAKITGTPTGTPTNLMLGTINLPATTQVIFSNASTLGGSANFTWDDGNARLSANNVRIPTLTTGDQLLMTDSDGDVQEAGVGITNAPAGGSGFVIEEYATPPTPVTGMMWIERVNATTVAWKYHDGTDTYEVQLSV